KGTACVESFLVASGRGPDSGRAGVRAYAPALEAPRAAYGIVLGPSVRARSAAVAGQPPRTGPTQRAGAPATRDDRFHSGFLIEALAAVAELDARLRDLRHPCEYLLWLTSTT